MIRVYEKSKKGGIQIKIKKEIIKIALLKMGKEGDLYRTTAHQTMCLAKFCKPFKCHTCMPPLAESERLFFLNNTRFPPLVNLSKAARVCLLSLDYKKCWFSV